MVIFGGVGVVFYVWCICVVFVVIVFFFYGILVFAGGAVFGDFVWFGSVYLYFGLGLGLGFLFFFVWGGFFIWGFFLCFANWGFLCVLFLVFFLLCVFLDMWWWGEYDVLFF